MTWTRDTFTITTDRTQVDTALVAEFLASSYWAKGIPAATVRKSIENALCFLVFDGERQVGFARVITDRATFAYIGDVFIIEACRGRGLSKWMMECIMGHPELQGLRRWVLATADAHGLYEQFGFTPVKSPERWMERHDAEVYTPVEPEADPRWSLKPRA